MKKFILASLASMMLLPTPIFANEEMTDETVMDVANEEMNEIATQSEDANQDLTILQRDFSPKNVINVSFKDEKGKEVGTGNIRNDNNKKLDLILSIPRGWAFTADPSTIDLSSKTIGVVELNAPNFDSNKPIYLPYQTGTSDPYQIVNFSNYPNKDNAKITADTINAALKNECVPFTTSSSYSQDYLECIAFRKNEDGKVSFDVVAYRSSTLQKAEQLKKVSEDYEGIELSIKFKNGDQKKVYLSDLAPTNGKIKLTSSRLAEALNKWAKENSKNGESPKTYSVTKWPTSKVDEYVAYGLENIDLSNTNGLSVYEMLPDDTSVTLNINNGGSGKEILTISNLTLGDLGKGNVSSKDFDGKIPTANIKNYLNKNFDKLEFSSAEDITFAVNLMEENKSVNSSLKSEVRVTLPSTPDKLYEQEYTLVFENAAKPGEIVDRDTRKWKEFFKDSVSEKLTDKTMTADVMPNGWKVAEVQQAGSKQKNKKETSVVSEAASINKEGKNLELSVFSSKEIKVYVYGGHMPSNGGGGASEEDPTLSEQPNIPSQGSAVMYRVYNPQTHEHLYTQDASEKEKLIAEGWNDEGHGWTAPAVSSYKVYRVFNPNSGEHHYTKDKNEYDTLVSYGWTGEGTAFFSADDVDSKVTLYRLYHPNAPESAKHHYTMSEAERDQMIADGWIPEGTAWYGLPN